MIIEKLDLPQIRRKRKRKNNVKVQNKKREPCNVPKKHPRIRTDRQKRGKT